jgi:DNA-binding NtrC family response regulator
MLEDNKSDVELLQYELKKSGLDFCSEVVQTSKDFNKALDNFKPDIILSDYSLPSFDGVSAFHIKQKKYPEIPFIIVSGTIGEENAVELIKSGVTDYSLKDKLFSLHHKILRALKDAKEKKEKKIADELLKTQYEKLRQIAFLQSHQVRGPIASILGLINLFNSDNPGDPLNCEVIKNLRMTTRAFDDIIHEIVQKTSEIEKIELKQPA